VVKGYKVGLRFILSWCLVV